MRHHENHVLELPLGVEWTVFGNELVLEVEWTCFLGSMHVLYSGHFHLPKLVCSHELNVFIYGSELPSTAQQALCLGPLIVEVFPPGTLIVDASVHYSFCWYSKRGWPSSHPFLLLSR